MYSVFQHWDPLKVCVVGRTYDPEFYSWIQNDHMRQRFQCMAEETEQDYQGLINLLQKKFGVQVVRPEFPEDLSVLKLHDRWIQPPVSPRDYYLMIHDQLWVPIVPNRSHANHVFNSQTTLDRQEFDRRDQQQHDAKLMCYQNIFDLVQQQGNQVRPTELDVVSGCFVSRIGKDLFFAIMSNKKLLHSTDFVTSIPTSLIIISFPYLLTISSMFW